MYSPNPIYTRGLQATFAAFPHIRTRANAQIIEEWFTNHNQPLDNFEQFLEALSSGLAESLGIPDRNFFVEQIVSKIQDPTREAEVEAALNKTFRIKGRDTGIAMMDVSQIAVKAFNQTERTRLEALPVEALREEAKKNIARSHGPSNLGLINGQFQPLPATITAAAIKKAPPAELRKWIRSFSAAAVNARLFGTDGVVTP
jgi:hypothetical protein